MLHLKTVPLGVISSRHGKKPKISHPQGYQEENLLGVIPISHAEDLLHDQSQDCLVKSLLGVIPIRHVGDHPLRDKLQEPRDLFVAGLLRFSFIRHVRGPPFVTLQEQGELQVAPGPTLEITTDEQNNHLDVLHIIEGLNHRELQNLSVSSVERGFVHHLLQHQDSVMNVF